MDTIKEYIKMCYTADDIQKLWKPTQGDDYTTNVSIELEEYNVYFLWGLMDKGFVWLPRQDQLQDIVKRKFGYEYAIDFGEWVGHGEECYLGNEASMEQLWLAFVMKEKYNKVWSGEDWITD